MLVPVKGVIRKKRVRLAELLKRGGGFGAGEGKSPTLSAPVNHTESISAEAYSACPCAVLPLPYSECTGTPSGFRRIAGEGVAPGPIPEGAYYRLYRVLGDMRRIESREFSVRQLDILEEPEDAALARRMARAAHCEFEPGAFAAKQTFTPSLCVAVHSRENGVCLGCGFGASDPAVGEAWIAALFVPGAEEGALMLLVNELLRRMARLAGFATVCVSAGDARLVRILRKSGFSGGDIWLGEQRPAPCIE